jgi:hypothetical protein
MLPPQKTTVWTITVVKTSKRLRVGKNLWTISYYVSMPAKFYIRHKYIQSGIRSTVKSWCKASLHSLHIDKTTTITIQGTLLPSKYTCFSIYNSFNEILISKPPPDCNILLQHLSWLSSLLRALSVAQIDGSHKITSQEWTGMSACCSLHCLR